MALNCLSKVAIYGYHVYLVPRIWCPGGVSDLITAVAQCDVVIMLQTETLQMQKKQYVEQERRL